MRVALCLSGQTRCFDRCFDSLRKYIIEPLNCDVFCHFWDNSQIPPVWAETLYNDQNALAWQPLDGDYGLDLIHKLSPRKLLIEPQKIFDVEAYANACTPENSRMQAKSFVNPLSMYYSILMANYCKTTWEHRHGFRYDCVIRGRTDLLFHEEIPQTQLDDLSKIYLPEEQGWGGYNDMFAFSSSDNMDVYADCINFIPVHFFERGGNFHPETFLKRHLEDKDMPVELTPMYYTLTR
jgi:hypothetical protein